MAQYEVDQNEEVEDDSNEIPLLQKVAIVMVALGEDTSGEVLKHLDDYEIEDITQAIAGLKSIAPSLIEQRNPQSYKTSRRESCGVPSRYTWW